MTKAQEVKKALKGVFNGLRATNGRGTAYGWVDLTFDLETPENCQCRPDDQARGWKTCNECLRKRDRAIAKVYATLEKMGVELYTYYSDDGYGTERDKMIININWI